MMLVEQGKLLIASMTHLHLYFANSTCATLYSSSILLLLCFASKESTLYIPPHFRTGNCLYILGRYKEAKEEFLLALESAEAGRNQWAYLLPQIYVNLGIALEGEGLVLSACEYYREAVILCPTHFRALKLLGSSLFGVGEYRAAVKALEEAIFMKPDYANAHCDLASVLHAMGEDEGAIEVFQKAIDLKPGHVDVLYNLGGLDMDLGRFQRASEMYTRVLAVWPNHWRAQLNKAVLLLGAGETKEAKRALKEALKMTNRVELHDATSHLLATALQIRALQRVARLSRCSVELLKKEMSERDVPVSDSGSGVPKSPSGSRVWKKFFTDYSFFEA